MDDHLSRPGEASNPDPLLEGRRPEPPHLNLEEALLNLDGDFGLYQQVAGFFLSDAPAYWEQFQKSHAEGDQTSAIRAIHTLKGQAASVGAETLRDHARALEAAAKKGDPAAIIATAPAVEQELARVLATLKGLLEARPG